VIFGLLFFFFSIPFMCGGFLPHPHSERISSFFLFLGRQLVSFDGQGVTFFFFLFFFPSLPGRSIYEFLCNMGAEDFLFFFFPLFGLDHPFGGNGTDVRLFSLFPFFFFPPARRFAGILYDVQTGPVFVQFLFFFFFFFSFFLSNTRVASTA